MAGRFAVLLPDALPRLRDGAPGGRYGDERTLPAALTAVRRVDDDPTYTDRDEEVVATVLSADNFWRNMGFDQASLNELWEASHQDAHNWRRQARMVLDALIGEGWTPPRREPGEGQALWMRGEEESDT